MTVASTLPADRPTCPLELAPAELLTAAAVKGLTVFADGDRLVVRGLKNADHDLVQTLLRRKAELMPLLLEFDADEQERYEERAAIAEYDGKLSLSEAEKLARQEVLDARKQR